MGQKIMRLFSKLYHKMIQWAAHPHASFYLATLSFAESSVFPIPPDVMLAPMTLAKPSKAWRYASITTLSSVAGGLFGYCLGMFFIHLIYPILDQLGYQQTYQQIQQWFLIWDFWIVFLAGFTPIPYKLFTIAAGAASMSLFPFLLASFIGRGARFFLVALLIHKQGSKIEPLLKKYIDWMGWALVLVMAIVYLLTKF